MTFFKLLKQYVSAKSVMLFAEKEYKELKDKSNLYRTICEDISNKNIVYTATRVSPYELRKSYHNDCKQAKLRYKQACREFSKIEYELIICVRAIKGSET